MKFNLKAIAAAVAIAATGSAHADLTPYNTNNGSFSLYAFTADGNYYIRDLGYLINSFLPNSVTTLAGDGGVTGDKTPGAGLTLNSTTNSANFADASFSSWLTARVGQTVQWAAVAGDSLSAAANGVSRLITTSLGALPTISNGQVTTFVAGANAGGLAGLFNVPGSPNPALLSVTGANTAVTSAMANNFGLGIGTLASIGDSVGLYYFARSAQSGSGLPAATGGQFGNATNFAAVSLDAQGNFSYTLAADTAAAVPIPAAAWLLGAGLMGLGGMVRRRKLTEQA